MISLLIKSKNIRNRVDFLFALIKKKLKTKDHQIRVLVLLLHLKLSK